MTKLTEKQRTFIHKLIEEREVEMGYAEAVVKALRISEDPEEIGLTKREASELIGFLLAQPRKVAEPQPAIADEPELTPGVFEVEGEIYVVKPNKARTHLYAKRLVEAPSDRLVETGEHVAIEFEYAPGAIRKIREEHRMPIERAKALTIRYGRCINCGRRLKVAESVERGIGPVCAGYFA